MELTEQRNGCALVTNQTFHREGEEGRDRENVERGRTFSVKSYDSIKNGSNWITLPMLFAGLYLVALNFFPPAITLNPY